MGKRSRYYESGSRFVRCEICNGEIPIEFYFDKGEVVFCSECDTEYILECRNPVILALAMDSYDDGYFDDLDYDD